MSGKYGNGNSNGGFLKIFNFRKKKAPAKKEPVRQRKKAVKKKSKPRVHKIEQKFVHNAPQKVVKVHMPIQKKKTAVRTQKEAVQMPAPRAQKRKSAQDIGFAVSPPSHEDRTIIKTTSGKEGVLLDFAHDEKESVGILQMMSGKVTVRAIGNFQIMESEEFTDDSDSFDFSMFKQKSLRVDHMPRPSTNYVLPCGTTDQNRTIITSLPILREQTKRQSQMWTPEKHFWTKEVLDNVNESKLKPFAAETPDSIKPEPTSSVNIEDIVPSHVTPRVVQGKVNSEIYMWKAESRHGKSVQKWCYVYKSTCEYLTKITLDFTGSKGLTYKPHHHNVEISRDVVSLALPPFETAVALVVSASGAYSMKNSTSKKYERVRGANGATEDIVDAQNEKIAIKIAEMRASGVPCGKSIIHWLHQVGQRFIDVDFPPLPTSVWENNQKESIAFRKYTDFWPDARIFVDFDVRADDVCQGKLGDCWLMSSVAALSEHSDLVDKLFLTQELNEAGVFQTKICCAGMWETFTLDGYFPCALGGEPVYTKSKSHALWALLLEKSFAKYFGSFERCEENDPSAALVALTGKPTSFWSTTGTDPETLWSHIMTSTRKADDLITITTNKQESMLRRHGLVVNHAYTILRAEEGLGKRLLCIRNPWGRDEWTGDWSDNSKCWTKKYRDYFQPSLTPEDGTFWIDFNEISRYFDKLTVCYCAPETKVTRMPMNSGISKRGEYSYYSMNLKIPQNGCVQWLGLHQIDENRKGALPFKPLVLLAFKKRPDGELIPLKSIVCHKAFQFENLDLGEGEYEILIFHCQKSDESIDNHTSTLTIHGQGPKFSLEAVLEHDTKRLKNGLICFAKKQGEKSESKNMNKYIYKKELMIWAVENTTDPARRYCCEIEAKVTSENKLFPSFVPDPDEISLLIEPARSDLLSVAITADPYKKSSIHRSMKVAWSKYWD